ncbi:TonB-dependent receptor [Novosphingobium sp. FSY-8]|uniref:TonB-dependent receptor n=1 Tax=Novosphingobium ovatum TaxID=1908523 RepID=A0ABW9XCG2_9SPHN|nr:TonB-dependent receptor [Novosphingobium ovatum]NBC36167.1 TonB-dependent receptor [Novosphingobium ovatum]
MRNINHFITGRAARAALLIGVCAPALAAMPAAAQTKPAAPTEGEIIVTGSRVRGEAPIGSAVTALSTADLAATGRVTVDRAIRELPQVLDLGVSENSRGQSGGSGNIVYSNSINLRGIGPNATLIIIDGHRVTNNSRSTDPSVLPTLGVERIEVVADGASAIYGSDAVAGVVNLIPRRHLNGLEMASRYGIADDGAYHESMIGAAYGHKFDRGQFMVAFEHVEKSNLNGDDRGFFRSNQTGMGGSDYSVTRCSPGTITAGGTTYAIPAAGLTSASQLTAGTSNKCDDLQGQDLIPRQKYDSMNATFNYQLTDWLEFFADGFYSYRSFERNPAYASATLTVPQTNAWFVRPTGFTGTSYTIGYNFVGDAARNKSWGHAESWQITPGIKVKLPMSWQFEALIGKGRTYDISMSSGGINNTALNAALASSSTATAFDPYGLHRTSASVLAGIFNQISYNPTIGHFTGYEARLNGPLIQLPGGMAKLAVGYEGVEFNVSLGRATGSPGAAFSWTNPSRRTDSAYAELVIPFFGADNAIPFFQKLELNAAIRYDKYSDVGSTTNPKFGINWKPVQNLMLRGSYGTSFRAPTLTQIYGNTRQLFVQNYQNPAGGSPIVGVALSGGNLNLKPETASTWSIGADFTPAPRTKLSLTYFDVDYKNQVVGLLSDLSVLTRASQYDGTGLIIQGAAAGTTVQSYINAGLAVSGALPGGSASNVTVFVDGRSQNLGRSITRGIDMTASYGFVTDKAGAFTLSASGTYLLTYRTKQTPTAPWISQINTIFSPMKFRARASINWELGQVGANVRLTHVGGYTNTSIATPQSVRSYTPIDLTLNYRIGEDRAKALLISLEFRNLFDVSPPYVNLAPSSNGSGGYDATASDPIGRQVAISLRKSF